MVDFIDLPPEVLAIITDHTFRGVKFKPSQQQSLKNSQNCRNPRQALSKTFSLLLVTKKHELNVIAKKSLMAQGTLTISSPHQYHTWKDSPSFLHAAQIARLRLEVYLHGELETMSIPEIARNFDNLRYVQIDKLCCGCWHHASVEHVFGGTHPKGGLYGDGPCDNLDNLVVSHLLGKHKLLSEDVAIISKLKKLHIDVENVLLYSQSSVHAHIQKSQVIWGFYRCTDSLLQFDGVDAYGGVRSLYVEQETLQGTEKAEAEAHAKARAKKAKGAEAEAGVL